MNFNMTRPGEQRMGTHECRPIYHPIPSAGKAEHHHSAAVVHEALEVLVNTAVRRCDLCGETFLSKTV